MSKVTVNRRHTGRIYVGLDERHFRAMHGLLLTAEIRREDDAPLDEEERRVLQAVVNFEAKNAEVAS